MTKTFSQENAFVFHKLSPLNGLTSGKYNYYIYTDQQSMAWISSTAGLNRFDSRNIHPYAPEYQDTTALLTEYAGQCPFYEDVDQNLWFTNEAAVIRYNRKEDNFSRYYAFTFDQDTIRNSYSWGYLDEKENRFWFTAGDYLFYLDIDHPERPCLVTPLEVSIRGQMSVNDEGQKQIYSFSTKSDTLVSWYLGANNVLQNPRFYNTPNQAIIKVIRLTTDSSLWVGTTEGLLNWNPVDQLWQKHYGAYQGEPVRKIIDVWQWHAQCLLVATEEQGIFFYNPEARTYFGQVNQFKEGDIRPFQPKIDRIYLDEHANLWVSTVEDDILYTNLRKPKFGMLGVGDPRLGTIDALTEGLDGEIWAATATGVACFRGKDITIYPLPISGQGTEKARFIYQDASQRVWVGTLSSLYVLHKGNTTFVRFHPTPALMDRPVGYPDMIELPNGDLLFGSLEGSCIRLQSDLQPSELPVPDEAGVLFFAFAQGCFFVYRVDDKLCVYELVENELLIDTVFQPVPVTLSIQEDKYRDRTWLGTTNGLYYLQRADNGKWTLFKDKQVNIRFINSLLLGQDSCLWMGTPQGLGVYHPDRKSEHIYTTQDGLQAIHFNLGAARMKKSGELVFGGSNGINIFHPSDIQSEVPRAKPLIADIRINQERGVVHLYNKKGIRIPAFVDQLELPHDKNNIYIKLSAREYSDARNCRFKYMIKNGSEEQEVDIGTNDELNFNNLAPGSYQLIFSASNSDGVWSEEGRGLSITVLPPWYRTTLFYLFCLFALMGIFYSIYVIRLRNIIRRQDLETSVLRLQMNPHFIFNSLNAIDAYIMGGNRNQAHEYLVRFAELMRGILNNSEQQMTSIEEEIVLLEKYLSTEKMRIGQRMTYGIEVDPQIDPYDVEIPTMILQPFIENAIWHGIAPKLEQGHIQINFRQEGEALVCEVCDDGVGRKQQKDGWKNHESKALKITERRLSLLRKKRRRASAHFEIRDEKDLHGKPAGTTVSIYLPL